MRKHVKPAHPEAAIPDPVRGGDLPPEGRVVDWSVHWARLAQRDDIIATDVDEADVPTKPKPKRAEPKPKASGAKGVGRAAKTRTNSVGDTKPASKPADVKSKPTPFPPKALTEATQRDTVSAITNAGTSSTAEAPETPVT